MIAKNGRKENECQPKMNFKKTYENICMINCEFIVVFSSADKENNHTCRVHT